MGIKPNKADFASTRITDYFSARLEFRLASTLVATGIETYTCPATGPAGEALAADVVRLGSPTASKVLIVVSGTHGLEGLAGSLCQTHWLGANPTLPDDVAVVLVHLLNPWGCAWRRRQTEDNVDLNRNFLDFTHLLPPNPHYDELKDALRCPDLTGAARQAAIESIGRYRQEKGERAYASALFQGQYTDPGGIGFGGKTATWSNNTFRQIVTNHTQYARTVALIDIHAGLGPYGHGMLIATSIGGSQGLALANAWYGKDIAAVREWPKDIPYEVCGDLCGAVEQMLPSATVVSVALEYGTYEFDRLLSLLIDDCWLMNHVDVHSPQGQTIRAALQNFFYPDDPQWRAKVTTRFSEVITQAVDGISVV